MCIGFHVKYPLFLSDLNFINRSSKNAHIKFHENPSNGSRVVPCRRTDSLTDTTKLIVTFEILRTRLETNLSPNRNHIVFSLKDQPVYIPQEKIIF